jgi:hypothetical protein
MLYSKTTQIKVAEEQDMEMNEKKIGEVTHFFSGPMAAVLKLSAPLSVGDRIHIVGFTTDLTEEITSMQIDHNSVQQANPGDDVAILVKDRVREGDEVFLAGVEAAGSPTPAPVAAAAPAAAMASASMMPAAPKPAVPAKPAAKPAAKAKPKTKAKAKAKAKAKPKAKPKAKAKAKPKKAAKAKSKKAKAKPKKKSKR